MHDGPSRRARGWRGYENERGRGELAGSGDALGRGCRGLALGRAPRGRRRAAAAFGGAAARGLVARGAIEVGVPATALQDEAGAAGDLPAGGLRVAARALGDVAILDRGTRDFLADQAEQAKRGARRELQVFAGIEPDRLSRHADVELDLAAHVTIETMWLHRGRAARTVHRAPASSYDRNRAA